MLVLITTVPGIEDVVIGELRERLGEEPEVLRAGGGRVLVITHNLGAVREMSTVERIHIVLHMCSVGKALSSIEDCLRGFKWELLEDYITPNTSIGVRSERTGTHDFTSRDVSALFGEWLMRMYKVFLNLDNPDLAIRIDVIEESMIISLEATRRSLRSRSYRRYIHPASLNPVLANAMVRMMGPIEGRVWDPTCGSGTIPIEGSLTYPGSVFLCTDIERGHVAGALENVREAGVDSNVDLAVMDATAPALRVDSLHGAALNPPFGIRARAGKGFYRRLMLALANTLSPGSRIALVTIRHRLVKRICEELGLKVLSTRFVEQGGLWSAVMILETPK